MTEYAEMVYRDDVDDEDMTYTLPPFNTAVSQEIRIRQLEDKVKNLEKLVHGLLNRKVVRA